MEWIECSNKLPEGNWSITNTHLSEEVLIFNGCGISIGYLNKITGIWYVDEPCKKEWIDDVQYWMPLPNTPY